MHVITYALYDYAFIYIVLPVTCKNTHIYRCAALSTTIYVLALCDDGIF
jgi:hypothetical protein